MFYHRSPAELRVEQVQAYLLHLILCGIGRLLGHDHPSTTSRDLHLARSKLNGNTSPLELLEPPS
ncbi:hypothetical protein [Accumulibacter sp.]|uniref:hypothetical protein n=1 Tax=Accumulibacter sp. TaxID=2053492 RepID=UPI0025F486EA|nr:hypothetical protein [Accumulibacter sp.]MCM8611634.1 hypothetical protein [Accumulibacter sp.]MCM8635660.1 hypothetical protein [Accumulibacter sp.]MCM8639223.1 hypothetical protein [Accumulibacter sp.]